MNQTTTTTFFAGAVVRSLDVPYEGASEALMALVRVFAAHQALSAISIAMADDSVCALVEAIGDEAWDAFEELEREVVEAEYATGGAIAQAWFRGRAGKYGPGLARAALTQAAITLYNGEWQLEQAVGLFYKPGAGSLESEIGDQAFDEENLVVEAMEFFRVGLKEYCQPCTEENWKALQKATPEFALAVKRAWQRQVKQQAREALDYLAQQLREEVVEETED